MSKKYSKRQIVEAIKHWKSQLNRLDEQVDASARCAPATSVIASGLLEALDVFDDQHAFSSTGSNDTALAKFSEDGQAALKDAFKQARAFGTKVFGLRVVMSQSEYSAYAEDNESTVPYEDYIDDQMTDLRSSIEGAKPFGALLRPSEILVVDNVMFDGKPGKTVLVVPYWIW